MKTQQRSFVVEYKSTRRRSSPQANAIWGSLDLKKIVLEAEFDAPHLFVPDASRLVPSHDPHLQQSAPLAEARADDVRDALAVGDVAPGLGSSFETSEDSVPIEPNESEAPDWHAVRSLKLRRKRAPKSTKLETVSNDASSVDADVSKSVMSLIELAALEEENRQLKTRLTEVLQAQNRQLRIMLARF